jgi:hypothetical protein
LFLPIPLIDFDRLAWIDSDFDRLAWIGFDIDFDRLFLLFVLPI